MPQGQLVDQPTSRAGRAGATHCSGKTHVSVHGRWLFLIRLLGARSQAEEVGADRPQLCRSSACRVCGRRSRRRRPRSPQMMRGKGYAITLDGRATPGGAEQFRAVQRVADSLAGDRLHHHSRVADKARPSPYGFLTKLGTSGVVPMRPARRPPRTHSPRSPTASRVAKDVGPHRKAAHSSIGKAIYRSSPGRRWSATRRPPAGLCCRSRPGQAERPASMCRRRLSAADSPRIAGATASRCARRNGDDGMLPVAPTMRRARADTVRPPFSCR